MKFINFFLNACGLLLIATVILGLLGCLEVSRCTCAEETRNALVIIFKENGKVDRVVNKTGRTIKLGDLIPEPITLNSEIAPK